MCLVNAHLGSYSQYFNLGMREGRSLLLPQISSKALPQGERLLARAQRSGPRDKARTSDGLISRTQRYDESENWNEVLSHRMSCTPTPACLDYLAMSKKKTTQKDTLVISRCCQGVLGDNRPLSEMQQNSPNPSLVDGTVFFSWLKKERSCL